MSRKNIVRIVLLPAIVIPSWFIGKTFVFNAIRTIAFVSDTANQFGIPMTDDIVKNAFFVLVFAFMSAIFYTAMMRVHDFLKWKGILIKLFWVFMLGILAWPVAVYSAMSIPTENITVILGKMHNWFGLWIGLDLRPSRYLLMFCFWPAAFSVWIAAMLKAVGYVNSFVFEVSKVLPMVRRRKEVGLVEVPDV